MSLRSMTLILVLGVALPQQEPPPLVDALLRRLRAEDPGARILAMKELLDRWKEWDDAALARIDQAAKSPDLDVATAAREAARKIRIRRHIGRTGLEGIEGIEHVLAGGNEQAWLKVLKDAAALWKSQAARDEDLVALGRRAAEVPWTKSVEDLFELISEDAVPPFRVLLPPLLRNPEAEIRAEAAMRIAEIGSRRYFSDVLHLLKDPDPRVRRNAVGAFRTMNTRERGAEIVPLLKERDPGVRAAALGALGHVGHPEHADEVAPFVEDPDQGVRYAAIGALGALRTPKYADRIAPKLKDPDRGTRALTCEALGRMGARQKAAEVASLLQDPNSYVRRTGATTLGNLGATERAGTLLPLLRDADDGVRYYVIEALGRIGARDSAKELIPLLANGEAMQSQVLEALGKLGAREWAAEVVPFLEKNKEGLRFRAARALGEMDALDHAGRLVPLLRDPHALVRRCAVESLCRMGVPLGLDDMVLLIKDDDWTVRHAAVDGLGFLGSEEHARKLAALFLRDSDLVTRGRALWALWRMGAKPQPGDVAPILKEQSPIERYGLLTLVGGLGDSAHAKVLIRHTSAADKEERMYAAMAAGRLAVSLPKAEREALSAALRSLEQDPAWEVRMGARIALVGSGSGRPESLKSFFDEYPAQEDFAKWFLAWELPDLLAQTFEKEASAGLQRTTEPSRRVETREDAVELLKRLGFRLEVHDEIPLRRRLPQGIKVSGRRLIEWAFERRGVIVPEGNRIRLLPLLEALEVWRRRLFS